MSVPLQRSCFLNCMIGDERFRASTVEVEAPSTHTPNPLETRPPSWRSMLWGSSDVSWGRPFPTTPRYNLHEVPQAIWTTNYATEKETANEQIALHRCLHAWKYVNSIASAYNCSSYFSSNTLCLYSEITSGTGGLSLGYKAQISSMLYQILETLVW